MVETKTIAITSGIIGVLFMSGLGIYIFTPEQLDKSYTCTTNNITGLFDSFSSTNVTAYWIIDGVKKQSVCTKGKWIKTTEWLKINGLSAEDITINSVNESIATEDNIKIVAVGDIIEVDKSQQISISRTVYNITYMEKPPQIVCVFGNKTGTIIDCLNSMNK
jgi:hypothetical protein